MKKNILIVFLAAAFFSACVSLQQEEIIIDNARNQTEINLAKIEEMVVPLEAAGGTQARRMQEELLSARRTITDLERDASADADYTGQLIAWSGRLAILEGRYSEAMRLYRQSLSVSSGNIPSIILGIRLEGDPALRLEIIDKELNIHSSSSSGYGELLIEKGRSLFELNRYAEAAGAFDAAFSSGLAGVYRENYGENRNRAWELRNTSSAKTGTIDMLIQDGISWNDCIVIAHNETQLLRFITGGRNLTETEIFNRLLDRAFIPYTQNINLNDWPTARPAGTELVTRSGAAWFIWHLYAEARADRGLLSRYSARYATGTNPRSPIADVPPLSPFFDSILGCVVTEFLSLSDGHNFQPERLIRGAELLAILKRIDN